MREKTQVCIFTFARTFSLVRVGGFFRQKRGHMNTII